MQIEYLITRTDLTSENGQPIHTYGIIASNRLNGLCCSVFEDISLSEVFTKRLLCKLNREKVELCHFYDVVMDALNA